MNTYTIFNEENIVSTLVVSEETLLLNINDGESYVEGYYPDDLHYVKEGSIRSFPEKPEYPVNFNKDTEEWVWDETVSWGQLRDNRNNLLSEVVDLVVSNPLRWASMTTEKQTEYTAYRQSLLDLPENTTDPRNPVWPTPPQ